MLKVYQGQPGPPGSPICIVALSVVLLTVIICGNVSETGSELAFTVTTDALLATKILKKHRNMRNKTFKFKKSPPIMLFGTEIHNLMPKDLKSMN